VKWHNAAARPIAVDAILVLELSSVNVPGDGRGT
jgi:hypothetical protein